MKLLYAHFRLRTLLLLLFALPSLAFGQKGSYTMQGTVTSSLRFPVALHSPEVGKIRGMNYFLYFHLKLF